MVGPPACRVVPHRSHEKQAADEGPAAEYQFGRDHGWDLGPAGKTTVDAVDEFVARTFGVVIAVPLVVPLGALVGYGHERYIVAG